MTSYQPVLWGKAAIVHFGVKSHNVGFFRDPMPEQVLGLLSIDRILHTCYNFNTRLPLEVSALLLKQYINTINLNLENTIFPGI